MDGVDEIRFSEGDRFEECRVLRRADGDRHVIMSVFTIRRGSGPLDALISGTGGIRWKNGVTEAFVREFMEDLRVQVAELPVKASYPVTWETVDFSGGSTIADDVSAMKKAGVPIWTEVLPEGPGAGP